METLPGGPAIPAEPLSPAGAPVLLFKASFVSGVAQDITQLNEKCEILEISTHTLLEKNTLTFKKGIMASFSSDLMD